MQYTREQELEELLYSYQRRLDTLRDQAKLHEPPVPEHIQSQIRNVEKWIHQIRVEINEKSSGTILKLPQRSEFFVNREEEIQRLTKHLLDPDITICSIVGPVGIGKTSLGVELAHKLLRDSPFTGGVCWLDCKAISNSTEQPLDVVLRRVQKTFAIQNVLPSIEEVRRYLTSNDCVLVFDDYHLLSQDLRLLSFLERFPKRSKVLLVSAETSRRHISNWTLELSRLDFTNSVKLFNRVATYYRVNISRRKRDIIADICIALEGNPSKIQSAATALARIWTTARPLQGVQSLVLLSMSLSESARSIILQEALSSVRRIEQAETRAQALALLAPALPDDERTSIFAEALGVAQKVDDPHRRLAILISLLKYLPEALLQQALAEAETLSNSPDFARYLNALGNTYRIRYRRSRQVTDIDQAISVLEQAVQRITPQSPDLPRYLNDLGLAYRDRYRKSRQVTDIDQAISVLEQAVQHITPQSPNSPRYLNDLGLAYRDRYRKSRQVTDIDQAISVLEQAVQHITPQSPDLPRYLNELGLAYRDRFRRVGDLDSLENAIAAFQLASSGSLKGSHYYARSLNRLGNALLVRFRRNRDAESLDQAVEVLQEAVNSQRRSSRYLVEYLSDLGAAFRERYQFQNNITDLDRAIDALEQASFQDDITNTSRALSVNTLGELLYARYRHNKNIHDLERAITLFEQGANSRFSRSVRSRFLYNLGIAKVDQYRHSHKVEHLDQGIAAFEKAVLYYPSSINRSPRNVIPFGLALHSRYRLTGELVDLERAIDVFEQAIRFTPSSSTSLPFYLTQLGLALRSRYDTTGDLVDLERAIDAFEQVVHYTPDSPANLNNLGAAYYDRYKRTGDTSALEQTISAFERALKQRDKVSGKLSLGVTLGNLGAAYLNLSTGDRLHNLSRALEVLHQALEFSHEAQDTQGMTANLVNLGHVYREIGDFDRATAFYSEAIEAGLCSKDLFDFSNVYSSLADIEFRKGNIDSGIEYLVRCIDNAVGHGISNIFDIAKQVIEVATVLLKEGLAEKTIAMTDRISNALSLLQMELKTTVSDSWQVLQILQDVLHVLSIVASIRKEGSPPTTYQQGLQGLALARQIDKLTAGIFKLTDWVRVESGHQFLELQESDTLPPRLVYLVNLASRYEHDENWGAAIEAYEQARGILNPAENKEELHRYAEISFRLALCLKQDGQWSKALDQQQDNVVMYGKLGHDYGKASAYLEIGHIYQMMNIYDLALLYYGEAYYLYRQAAETVDSNIANEEAQYGMASSKESLGFLQFQLGIIPKALDDLNEAEQLYMRLKMIGKAEAIRQTVHNS